MEPSSIEEVREDLLELKELRKVANRKYCLQLLDQHIEKISQQLEKLLNAETTKDSKSPVSPEKASKAYTVSLRTYSWDQSDKFLKLYVTIPELKISDSERVSCDFGKRNMTLRVCELAGKNYELIINNLAKAILPEKSSVKTKDGMVVVMLNKERQGQSWEAVTAEEVRLKEKNKPKNDYKPDDPSSGLMDLMKKMYDEGDDQMKQMLNKTWYESQMKSRLTGNDMPEYPGMDI